MKNLIVFSIFLLLAGCNLEDCHDTDVVDYYETRTTLYYTITEPVYKQECN